MELSNKEKYLLTLYSEFFGLEYDLNDDRIINVGKGFLKRHIEMQNIAYLIGKHKKENKYFDCPLIYPSLMTIKDLKNEELILLFCLELYRSLFFWSRV